MSTTITNSSLEKLAQTAVEALSGLKDSTRFASVAYNGDVCQGDAVKVPVLAFGDSSTESSFATDGTNSFTFVSILANHVAKTQVNMSPSDYQKLRGFSDTMIKGMVRKAGKTVSDAALALVTSTNFTKTAKVAGWSESDVTLAKIQAAVGAALKLGTIDPASVKVCMPADTYFATMAVLNALPREIELGFEILPIYNSAITQTFITDGSAIGIGLASDIGLANEESEMFATEDDSLAYSVHVINDPISQSVIVGARFIYGVEVLNSNGLVFVAAKP